MKDPFPRSARLFLLAASGALVMSAAPPLLEALTAPDTPALWWIARASGLLAYVALWLSTVFGALLASRGAGGLLAPHAVLELHTRWALAAVLATAVHVLAVVGDAASQVSPLVTVAPLGAALTPPGLRQGVAFGVLALWGMTLIGGSTALLRKLKRSTWRAIHAAAFGVFALAMAHGLTAGSESSLPLVRALYVATGAVVLAAVVQRALLSWAPPDRGSAPRQEPARSSRASS